MYLADPELYKNKGEESATNKIELASGGVAFNLMNREESLYDKI